MEEWKVFCKGIIPRDVYQVRMTNGEETGLSIELIGSKNRVIINFGVVISVRMIDEGMVQKAIYADEQIAKFKTNNFKDVIYELENGEFKTQMQEIADGYLDVMDIKHYVVITLNYNIDIITLFVPEITVYK